MLSWFGRRHSEAKSPYRASREVIAHLTGSDSVRDLAMVTTALDAVMGNDALLLEDRFSEIHKLDAAAQPCHFNMIREYLATPRHKKARESELWGGAYGYLIELYSAYLSCLQRYEADPRGAARFRMELPIAVVRALRALRLQLKWALLRYITPEQRIWTEMAGLYSFAVSNGLAAERIPFYPGQQIIVQEEFVKALMIATASSDSLRPEELDLATRLVDHYARFFVIAEKPFEGCTHWFNLRDPGRPARATREPPENSAAIQYFGAGEALANVEAVLAEMSYTGEMPQDLQFYEKQDSQLLSSALKHLALDWAGKTQARRDQRRKITSRVTVVPGLTEIMRALDFAVNDSLDFTDQPAAESWIVEDSSEGGYGAVIPSVAGDWVEVGSLVGIEGASIREWRIGVIRRVNRLEGDQQRVGVQLLGSDAALVALTQEDGRPTAKSAADSPAEPAVLITGKPKRHTDVEVLVRSGMFTNLNETDMRLGNKRYRLKPTRVVERNARAERVAFQVAE
jgi:hypothetical protein